MLRANIRVEQKHIDIALSIDSAELLGMLVQQGVSQENLRLVSTSSADGERHQYHNPGAIRSYAKRMASWRNAAHSGLCAPPRDQDAASLNSLHTPMINLVRVAEIPDYVISHIVKMEESFAARHSHRFHYQSLDGQLGTGTSNLGPRTFTCIARYLGCDDLRLWPSINKMFGYELCDTAAFASVVYRIRFAVVFSLVQDQLVHD